MESCIDYSQVSKSREENKLKIRKFKKKNRDQNNRCFRYTLKPENQKVKNTTSFQAHGENSEILTIS